MSQDTIPELFRQRIKEAKEQQLEELDLSNEWNTAASQKLTQIPDEVFELTHLKVLNLSSNQLNKLPESLTNLSNLTTLDLSSNQLNNLPESLTNLSNLSWLDLSSNQLTTLPKFMGDFSNLSWLDLSFNQLNSLPKSTGSLSKLTRLDLRNNQLNSLPKSIGNLSNLTRLNLSNNQLTTLSESITKLSNLTELNLSNNQLTILSESITKLSKLTTLSLSNNQLTILPESITKLSNLTTLSLDDNPLERPPLEVAQKGIEAIGEYFRQLKEEGTDYIYEAKLLIVGEAGAGKTTLAKKIENPNYKLDTNEKSTEGIDITKWSFPFDNEREFRVNIWDFGGQEIYHTTHQFFLTKRSLYALVADTRKEDTDFYYWLNVVELLSNNSPLLIIKNEKGDRYIDIDENSLRGRFENLKESLATNLQSNRGLQDILDSIQYHIAKLPHVGSALPKTWKRVREALEQDQRNYISLEEYLQICQENGFTQHKDKLQLSGYLHDLGVCLHFQDSPLLKNTVILKPEWGTDAVYKVLDDKQVINNLGRFTTKDLDNIWSDEQYYFKQPELLELMKKFKLCYQIPVTQDTYIAPQLLTKTKPSYDWDETDNLILRYTYEFMPKGIITQLIVAMHQHIHQQQYVWRSGVVLNKDETLAEVIEDYLKREIRIRVTGKFKRNLMTEVTYELDKINNSYHRLKYQKLVPCNCCACINSQNPHSYKFNKLLERIAHNQLTIQCDNPPYHQVQVLGLIDNTLDLKQLISQDKQDRNHSIRFEGDIKQLVFQLLEQGDISGDFMTGDRYIQMEKGNYNENIQGDYYEQKGNDNTISNVTQSHSSSGDNVIGDKNTTNIYNSQDLQQAAADIQSLLAQLEKTYPTNTTLGKVAIAEEAIQRIDNDPQLAPRILSALKAGGISALDSFLDHPAASFVIAALDDWQQTKSI